MNVDMASTVIMKTMFVSYQTLLTYTASTNLLKNLLV